MLPDCVFVEVLREDELFKNVCRPLHPDAAIATRIDPVLLLRVDVVLYLSRSDVPIRRDLDEVQLQSVPGNCLAVDHLAVAVGVGVGQTQQEQRVTVLPLLLQLDPQVGYPATQVFLNFDYFPEGVETESPRETEVLLAL